MYEGIVQSLIDELGRLPGVGPKGAQRIAFYLLATDATDVRRIRETLCQHGITSAPPPPGGQSRQPGAPTAP